MIFVGLIIAPYKEIIAENNAPKIKNEYMNSATFNAFPSTENSLAVPKTINANPKMIQIAKKYVLPTCKFV